MRPQGVRLPQTARADMESAPTDLYQPISASAPLSAWAIWSGQLVGLRPQVVPSMRAMASSAFMPGSSLAMPFRSVSYTHLTLPTIYSV